MTFSGNKLVNMNTIFAVVCLPLLLIILPINENTWLIVPALVLFVYFFFFWEAYYFSIEENTLIIKNIAWPFLKRRYNISEIKSISILEKGFRSFSKAKLRIFFNTEKPMTYRAASLRVEDWRLFIKEIQKLNIKIEVEPYLLKTS